MSYVLIR
jgi:hypothetical protein